MVAPILVPCLVVLRAEVDKLAPNRDRGADGWIGDKAHQQESSDHNPDDTPGVKTPYTDADHTPEVHAIDVDATGPWPTGKDLDWITETIRGRHLRGFDNRLQNIIYRKRIASASWGWTWKEYPGADPHTGHAHFSAVYTSAQEADTRSWGLLEPLGRTPALEALDGYALPILKLGDDDHESDGFNRIERAQRILVWLGKYSGELDGAYGPKTAAAVKALGLNDGRTIDRDIWVKLYGLSRMG